MSTRYQETYRGVCFFRTNTGVWGFTRVPNGIAYCSNYFTDDELRDTDEAAMRRVIDRMLARNPIYNGDVRYRNA